MKAVKAMEQSHRSTALATIPEDQVPHIPIHFSNLSPTQLTMLLFRTIDDPRGHFSMERKKRRITKLLLYGAFVNETDESGFTPLHYAVALHMPEIAHLLLIAGARHDIRDNKYNKIPQEYIDRVSDPDFFRMYTQWAIRSPYQLTAALFEALKEESSRRTLSQKKEYITKLLSLGAFVNYQDQIGQTPLHYVVAFKQRSIAHLLIKWGARLDIYDAYNRSPLQFALDDNDFREKLIQWTQKYVDSVQEVDCAAQCAASEVVAQRRHRKSKARRVYELLISYLLPHEAVREFLPHSRDIIVI